MTAIAYISLVLWFIAAVSLAPSARRYLRGPFNLVDGYRTTLFFAALLWTGGLGRLVFAPDNESLRYGILAISCALAVQIIVIASQGRLK